MIHSKLSGITFLKDKNRKRIKKLVEGEILTLKRDKDNPHDFYAVKTYTSDDVFVGFVKRPINKDLAEEMDKGIKFYCEVDRVTGRDKEIQGVNIILKRLEETKRDKNEKDKN